jgi:methionine synthase I (cobalamin-dependent)
MGDIGPSGDLMEPMGTMTLESGQALFAEQIRGLVAGGVDAILIETMSPYESFCFAAKLRTNLSATEIE